MRPNADEGAPSLLAMFVAGTLTVVGAVVAIGRLRDDWADVGAIVLVLVVLALVLIALAGYLSDDEDP